MHYEKEKEQFCDERDGKIYVYVDIGGQIWMAENLNYNEDGSSRCYENYDSYCNTYGRLYNWETAKEVCPTDWHLPNAEDWDALMRYVQEDNGDSYSNGTTASVAGKYLKVTASGWIGGNGEDTYGFSALPGGRYFDGRFGSANLTGTWWSSAESNGNYAYRRNMSYDLESLGWLNNFDKSSLLSVRCVHD
jgi:uncharacterized protein (TIGR02145 family)